MITFQSTTRTIARMQMTTTYLERRGKLKNMKDKSILQQTRVLGKLYHNSYIFYVIHRYNLSRYKAELADYYTDTRLLTHNFAVNYARILLQKILRNPAILIQRQHCLGTSSRSNMNECRKLNMYCAIFKTCRLVIIICQWYVDIYSVQTNCAFETLHTNDLNLKKDLMS